MKNEVYIRPLIKKCYGIDVNQIWPLKSGVQNSNFLVSNSKCQYIFRVYSFKHIGEIAYTIKTLLTLQKNDFPSPRLLQTLEKQWYSLFQNRPCILYRYIPGKNVQKVSSNLLNDIGKLQARMHLLLKNETDTSKNLTWDYNDLLMLINQKSKDIRQSGFPNASGLINLVKDEMMRIEFPDSLPKGGTHQDIKPENVIVFEDRVNGIVDFDNSYWGDLLHDITTTICWYCFSKLKFYLSRFELFISSYQNVRPLHIIEKEYLYHSIRFRLLREAIIWPIYVSHRMEIAEYYSDYFLNLYKQFSISESNLKEII